MPPLLGGTRRPLQRFVLSIPGQEAGPDLPFPPRPTGGPSSKWWLPDRLRGSGRASPALSLPPGKPGRDCVPGGFWPLSEEPAPLTEDASLGMLKAEVWAQDWTEKARRRHVQRAHHQLPAASVAWPVGAG